MNAHEPRLPIIYVRVVGILWDLDIGYKHMHSISDYYERGVATRVNLACQQEHSHDPLGDGSPVLGGRGDGPVVDPSKYPNVAVCEGNPKELTSN